MPGGVWRDLKFQPPQAQVSLSSALGLTSLEASLVELTINLYPLLSSTSKTTGTSQPRKDSSFVVRAAQHRDQHKAVSQRNQLVARVCHLPIQSSKNLEWKSGQIFLYVLSQLVLFLPVSLSACGQAQTDNEVYPSLSSMLCASQALKPPKLSRSCCFASSLVFLCLLTICGLSSQLPGYPAPFSQEEINSLCDFCLWCAVKESK